MKLPDPNLPTALFLLLLVAAFTWSKTSGSQSLCEASTPGEINACLASGNDAHMTTDIVCNDCTIYVRNASLYGNGHTLTRQSGQKSNSLIDLHGSGIGLYDLTLDDGPGDTCVPDDQCPRTVQLRGSNLRLTDVTIRNSKAYTIGVDNVSGMVVNGLSLLDGGIVGLYIGSSTGVIVRDSTFHNVGSNALAVLGGSSVIINNNTFLRNHARGYWPVRPQFGTGLTGGGQVYIARGSDILVSNNTIRDGHCAECRGGVSGIEIGIPNEGGAVDRLTLRNNDIGNNSASDIYVNQNSTPTNSDIRNIQDEAVIEEPNEPEVQGICYNQTVGLGFAEAYIAYSHACSEPRVDCDLYQDSIVCASVRMASSQQISVMLGGDPVDPVDPDPEPTTECTNTTRGVGFDTAYARYSDACSLPRRDCDSVDGYILCASFNITSLDHARQYLTDVTDDTGDTDHNDDDTGDTGDTEITQYHVLDIPVPNNSPGGLSWADSYSYQNKCYIASTFDHGAGNLSIGGVNARTIQANQNPPVGISQADAIYNDINCGNGPPNTAGDERWCPGRVDLGRIGCRIAGPDIRNQL